MITITMPTSFAVLIAVLLALDIIKGVLVLIDNRLTRTRMSLTKRQTEQADRIPFDPMTEMTIKQMIEERLMQNERSE